MRKDEASQLYRTDSDEYFRGMFTSPFKESDRERDMVTPTLKFVGRAGLALVVLFALFLKSNNLI